MVSLVDITKKKQQVWSVAGETCPVVSVLSLCGAAMLVKFEIAGGEGSVMISLPCWLVVCLERESEKCVVVGTSRSRVKSGDKSQGMLLVEFGCVV